VHPIEITKGQQLDPDCRRIPIIEFGAISIADFAVLGWAWRHERHRVDLTDYPNVKRWYETMMARPATKRGFDVALDRGAA
jgi:GSH-dependent disulfide-bond oxidoreductase